jgi:exopolyphosphatase/guanosine-5'-triphosphate,3'-diphosphate pyrophosphatase
MKLAAIDIGSNAVRLQIVRVNENPNDKDIFKKVEFVRVPIRLGDDAFKKQWISKSKRKIFKQAMQAFKLMLEAFEVDHYMACATSAMREADNGKKIAGKIYDKCGLKINIITGVRESEIILPDPEPVTVIPFITTLLPTNGASYSFSQQTTETGV